MSSPLTVPYGQKAPEPNKDEVLAANIPMLLWCPCCGKRHIDVGEFATKKHHTHACQFCGMTWRPALCFTVGVQFLPGYKNKEIDNATTKVCDSEE